MIEIKTVDLGLGTSKQALMADSKADKFIPKKVGTKAQKTCIGKINKKLEICKFFKNERCNKSDDECRFEHPKICRKFNQFGPKIDNNKGCGEKCNFFHPNACKNSMKDKTCSYKDCRINHSFKCI